MQTIQLEYKVDNYIYEEFLKSGKDIKDKIKEFLIYELNIIDDGYPTIGTEEAKRRVAKEVEDYYENGSKNCTEFNQNYWDEIDDLINNVRTK